MIKINDKKIDLFLEYYENGYSEIPGEAFVRAGFVNSLNDASAPMLYRELMSKSKVSKFIENFTKNQVKNRKKALTDPERLLHLSNLVRDSSLYCINKDGQVTVKDPKHMIIAIKEINSMLEDPVKRVQLLGDPKQPVVFKNEEHNVIGKELLSSDRAAQVLAILAEHDGLPIMEPSDAKDIN